MQILVHEPRAERQPALLRQCARARLEPVFLGAEAMGSDYLWQSAETEGRAILLAELPDTLARLLDLRGQGHRNPAIVLRDRPGAEDTARFLDAGADDVIVAPLEPVELASRVHSVLRRYHGHAGAVVKVGALAVPLNGGNPEMAGKAVALTRREQEVLQALALQAGRMVTKDALYHALYGMTDEPPLPKVVEVHVCTLRRKLSAASTTGESHIQTVKRRGYRLGLPV